MTGNVTALAFVQDCCRRMAGQPLWRARIGIGSLLSLEVGTPHVDPWGRPRGDVHLWIYNADWCLRDAGQLLAHCEDDHDTMQAAADRLVGSTVTALTHEAPDHLTLTTGAGVTLTVHGFRDPEVEDWYLFMDELVVTACAGELSVKPSGEPRPQA